MSHHSKDPDPPVNAIRLATAGRTYHINQLQERIVDLSKGRVLPALAHRPDDGPGALLWQESLWNAHDEEDVQRNGQDQHDEHEAVVSQHPGEGSPIVGTIRIEDAPPARYRGPWLVPALDPSAGARNIHRRGGERDDHGNQDGGG